MNSDSPVPVSSKNELSLRQYNHLQWRSGFGPTLPSEKTNTSHKLNTVVDSIFLNSNNTKILNVIPTDFPSMQEVKSLDSEERKALRKESKQLIKKLNLKWLDEMAFGESQLREKMSLFWHDHFACSLNNIWQCQTQINTIRTNALGSFRDLLFALSKDEGMIRFLNNQQNNKAHPNENFARELLELFTLGEGNYSEEDIKEAARAFTGWGVNSVGEFRIKRKQHDSGEKTFLGKTGNFGGEDILNILLADPGTAKYIVQKVYSYFVNSAIDADQIDKWTNYFIAHDLNISSLLREIFSSEHFMQEGNIGTKIKSPIEYLAGMMRWLNLQFQEDSGPLFIQRILGQVLLKPPNIAGWPDGISWIDSNSVLHRLNFAKAIILLSELDILEKESLNGFDLKPKTIKKLHAQINWAPITNHYENIDLKELAKQLKQSLLQTSAPYLTQEFLGQFVNINGSETIMTHYVLRIMSTPEYQLC